MIREAGIGVVMGNASQTVKDAADHVTNSVDDDGIYQALKYLKVIQTQNDERDWGHLRINLCLDIDGSKSKQEEFGIYDCRI